jgi:hypothetical protein
MNASDVRLTIIGNGGVFLLDSLSDKAEAERAKRLTLPSPPKSPQGRYVDLTSLYRPDIMPITRPHLLSDLMLEPRDPTDF